MKAKNSKTRAVIGVLVLAALCVCSLSRAAAGISILNYNVNGIGEPNTPGREALQRIVDYFDPDIITFQEAKGTTYPEDFLASNSDYEGYYSDNEDGAHNRRMIMSKYDIIDSSLDEYPLGEGSVRTLYAATIDLPGARDLRVFTAHWKWGETSNDAQIRLNESAESVRIIETYRAAHPNSFYVYTGDLNEEDNSVPVTNLLDPNVGLVLLTPVDLNNDSNATINSDPNRGTYLDRRIDYVLPSASMMSFAANGRILNTWTYTAETIPEGLTRTDTIEASDHLPIMFDFVICVDPPDVDLNNDCRVDFWDVAKLASKWLECGLDPPEACWE